LSRGATWKVTSESTFMPRSMREMFKRLRAKSPASTKTRAPVLVAQDDDGRFVDSRLIRWPNQSAELRSKPQCREVTGGDEHTLSRLRLPSIGQVDLQVPQRRDCREDVLLRF
jgi:hypothetical protein